MSWKRLLLVAALASVSATAAIAIVVLLFGDFGETAARILGTTLAISLYSLIARPGTVLSEQRRAQPLAFATIGIAAVGLVTSLVAIWIAEGSETTWRVAGTVTAGGFAAAQAAALTSRRRGADSEWVRRVYAAALAAVVLLAVLASVAIWAEIDEERFYRGVAAVAVLDLLLVVLQPLIRRLGGPTPAGGGETRIVVVAVAGATDAAVLSNVAVYV
jgi:hypothetical protein